MKKIAALVFLLNIFVVTHAQWIADSIVEKTLYYLTDTTEFLDEYAIAGEIYEIHTRFMDDPGGIQSYSVLEIEFLISTKSIGETIQTIGIFRDTLNSLLFSVPVNDIIDSQDVYPNWYKIPVQNSPLFTDYIEIPNPLQWLCIPKYSDSLSGYTIGFWEGSQQWGVTIDYPVKVTIRGQLTGIPNEITSPGSFQLYQNFPNPFNPSTSISYSIPEYSNVIIKVLDILGNQVEILVNEEKPAGNYELKFDGSRLSSGVYFYHLRAGSFVDIKKMILMK